MPKMMLQFKTAGRLERRFGSAGCALMAFLIMSAAAVSAAAEPLLINSSFGIVVQGRTEVTVTTPVLRLGDLAEILCNLKQDDETVIAMQKIFIEKSPLPGRSLTLSATQLLDKMRRAGIDLDEVGYTFPKVVTVRRAGRQITEGEVRSSIETYLERLGKDVTVKQISFFSEAQVSPGEITLAAEPAGSARPGKMDFIIRVNSEDDPEVKFEASAVVDEWREVPVARQSLSKGIVVQPDDVLMARMNVALLPRDIADAESGIIGLKLDENVASGETFHRARLAVPPVIEAGSKVTIAYRRGLLEASATGIALEAGIPGQEIKIKNDASKRIITGTAIQSGLVEVKP